MEIYALIRAHLKKPSINYECYKLQNLLQLLLNYLIRLFLLQHKHNRMDRVILHVLYNLRQTHFH